MLSAAVPLLGAQGPLRFGAQRWRDLHLRILHRFARHSCRHFRRCVADNDGPVLALLHNWLRRSKLRRGTLRDLYFLIGLRARYIRLRGCPSLKLPEKDI